MSLGAVRPVAAVQLLHLPTSEVTLSLANFSGGPFDAVVTTPCLRTSDTACDEARVLTLDAGGTELRTRTVSLPAVRLAAFVQLRVLPQSVDDLGACTCGTVHELRVFSPGVLPDAALPPYTRSHAPAAAAAAYASSSSLLLPPLIIILHGGDGGARKLRRFGTPPPPPPPPSRAAAQPSRSTAAFVAIALVLLLVVAAAAGVWWWWWRRRARVAHSQQPPRAAAGDDVALLVGADSASRAPVAPPQHVQQADDNNPAVFFDVFLSYDQDDWRLADALYDKLRLRGLHVHKSAARDQAPFDAARLRALRAAPTFAPVFTLSTLQRMAAAAGAGAKPDPALAECLAALYFQDAAAARESARWTAENRRAFGTSSPCCSSSEAAATPRLIHPVLVGPEVLSSTGPLDPPTLRWSSLLHEPGYEMALAALPDAVPGATTAAVDAALRAVTGAPLPPTFAALSVRDIMLGRAASSEAGAPSAAAEARKNGVLSGPRTPFALACAHEHLDLHIAGRYAPPILALVGAGGGARRGVRSKAR